MVYKNREYASEYTYSISYMLRWNSSIGLLVHKYKCATYRRKNIAWYQKTYESITANIAKLPISDFMEWSKYL